MYRVCYSEQFCFKDQLLGEESDVTLNNETTQRYPLAFIDIDCPFFSGQTEAL